jgi:hypothetical protein
LNAALAGGRITPATGITTSGVRLYPSVSLSIDLKRPWFTNTQEQQAKGRACLERYPTVESYVEAMVAEALSRIETADKGPEVVLQWSQSERAAAASINSHAGWHVDVRVAQLVPDPEPG